MELEIINPRKKRRICKNCNLKINKQAVVTVRKVVRRERVKETERSAETEGRRR